MSHFLHTLNIEERRILRKVVKRVHLKYHPKELCTDREADKLIATIGPEVAANLVRIGKKYNVDDA